MRSACLRLHDQIKLALLMLVVHTLVLLFTIAGQSADTINNSTSQDNSVSDLLIIIKAGFLLAGRRIMSYTDSYYGTRLHAGKGVMRPNALLLFVVLVSSVAEGVHAAAAIAQAKLAIGASYAATLVLWPPTTCVPQRLQLLRTLL